LWRLVQAKSLQLASVFFERGGNLLQNRKYTTFCIQVEPIVRNRVAKLEF